MTNYVMALMHLVPNANIRYQGVEISYKDIEWLDERPQPTKAECEAVYPQVAYEQELARVQARRAELYRTESDPLFFYWQAGEGTEAEWLASRQKIRDENPYPEAP
jgi:hypothetical protein